jgi:hypothetical protein
MTTSIYNPDDKLDDNPDENLMTTSNDNYMTNDSPDDKPEEKTLT